MKRAETERIQNWIDTMDEYNETPGNGTTREVFSREEQRARAYIKEEMCRLGLQVTEDCVGNIFGRLAGSDPSLAPVWTGSHIDTVQNGGKFDGMAGIFAGMEALRLLQESGISVKRDLYVNVYSGEEMSRYGICCVGSRALAGRYRAEELKHFRETSGQSLYERLVELGYDLTAFDTIKRMPGDVYASLELHIEQNKILEESHSPIGIVTGICAPTNLMAEVEGVQAHAGGTSMTDRMDACMAAAEIALLLEQETKEADSAYITGTVGQFTLFPGAVNVIPGKAVFSIDIRSICMEDKEKLLKRLEEGMEQIKSRRCVKTHMIMQNHDKPLLCDRHLQDILEKKCMELHVPYRKLISGAYHDSLMLGDFTRVGMIFIPCRKGISHSPEEWADYEDIARGAELLAMALAELGNEV